MRLNELRELIREALRKAYEILGVSPSASQEEIKKAYRAKALELHPDRNPGKDTSDDAKKVNIAFGLLSDPDKRATYDMRGDTTLGDRGSSFGPTSSTRSPPPQGNVQDDWWKRWQERNPQGPGSKRQQSQTPQPSKTRYFIFHDVDGLSLFWTVKREGATLVISFGDVGAAKSPTTKTKNYYSETMAASAMQSFISDRKNAGYVETTAENVKPKPQSSRPPRSNYGDDEYEEDFVSQEGETRYWVAYSTTSSKKMFWTIKRKGSSILTSWGFVEDPKTVKSKVDNYVSTNDADQAAWLLIQEKKSAGYIETDAEDVRPSSASDKQPSASTKPSSGKKETYKIYGKKDGAPAHTRFKGKVYKAAADTKFKNGDQANVNVSADGKLNVKDPKTGHTQRWGESVEDKEIDQIILESFMAEVDDE